MKWMMYQSTKMYVICIDLMSTQPSLHLQIKVLELDNFVGFEYVKVERKLVEHRAGTGVTGMELRAMDSREWRLWVSWRPGEEGKTQDPLWSHSWTFTQRKTSQTSDSSLELGVIRGDLECSYPLFRQLWIQCHSHQPVQKGVPKSGKKTMKNKIKWKERTEQQHGRT